MAALTDLPLLFLFLIGMGCVHQSTVVADITSFIEVEEVEITSAPKEEDSDITHALEVEDSLSAILKSQIDDNSVALSRLNNLLENLIGFMVENPCIEQEVIQNVTEVMVNGFTTVSEALHATTKGVPYLKLFLWRLNFAKNNQLPHTERDTPCPHPFFIVNDECIFIEGKHKRPYRYAKMACRLMGGFLAEPQDLGHFAAYIHTIRRDAEVFIGVISPEMNGKNGTYQYESSGDVIEDIPWDDNDPRDEQSVGCMVAKDRHYRDMACTYRRIYACEIDMERE